MRRLGVRTQRAFTLVELMIVVAIIGVLAALAIYAVESYIASAKGAEAKQHVGAMSRAATAAFERENADAEDTGEGMTGMAITHELCADATPVPNSPNPPQGTKYQPFTTDNMDFDSGDAVTGWKCLKFEITQPIHYQYWYTANSSPVTPMSPTACVADCYEAAGKSDLNGDGMFFGGISQTGRINLATGALKRSTYLHIEEETN